MRLLLVAALLGGCVGELEPDDPTPSPPARFCADSGVTVAGGGPWQVSTGHYEITVGASWSEAEAEELGRLAEASWWAFQGWFSADAEGPLEVVLDDTEADWEATIAADGLDVPFGAGGYFHPTTERAYLYAQPTVYYTRVLLLHELAHQYHRLGAGSDADADWYTEGMAEHLGRHHWDGDCVRLGARPLGTLEDFAARALSRWDEGASLEDIVEGREGRPLGMALVGFLESAVGPEFAGIREDAANIDEDAEAAALLDDLDDPDLAFDTWLRGAQLPMTPVFLEWLPREEAVIEGFADGVVSFARLKEAPARYEQRIVGRGDAGALIDFSDGGRYTALLVSDDGSVNAFEVDDTGAFWWDAGAVAPREGPLEWSQEFVGDEVVVSIGGEEIRRPLRFPAAAGPAVNDASIRFEAIDWAPR